MNATDRVIKVKDTTPGLVITKLDSGEYVYVARSYMVGKKVVVHLAHSRGGSVGRLEDIRGDAVLSSNTDFDEYLF